MKSSRLGSACRCCCRCCWPARARSAAEKVNINTADAATIDRVLLNIGPSKAEAIVAYRKANGPFRSAEQLAMVKGIGLKTVEKNRDRIVFAGGAAPAKPAAAARRRAKPRRRRKPTLRRPLSPPHARMASTAEQARMPEGLRGESLDKDVRRPAADGTASGRRLLRSRWPATAVRTRSQRSRRPSATARTFLARRPR